MSTEKFLYKCFSSVSQSCLTLCDPMDCSTPALPLITSSQNLLKLMSIESVMPSNHLILIQIFTAALFIIAKMQKQLNDQQVTGQITNAVYWCNRIFFIKKRTQKSWKHYAKWNKPDTKERIMWFHLQEIFRTEKSIRDRKIKHCQGVEGMEKGVLTANEYGFIFGVMKMFKNYILVIVIHVCKYIKNTVLLKGWVRDFPGNPVVKTLPSNAGGCRFKP